MVHIIVILGHSLGAMLGPKIVYANKEVSAFISLAGSSRKLEDIIVDPNKKPLENLELKKSIIER